MTIERKGRPGGESEAARSQQHPEITQADALALTDRIKVDIEGVWSLIKRAHTERAWAALGYSSWDDYCIREFGTSRLRLPREERTEVVASLRESGLSIRAIAAATGLNKETVNNVTRELSGNRTPEPEPVTVEPEPELAPVIGMDGKRYQSKPSPPQPAPKPWRKPPTYRDEFSRAVYDLERLVERFAGLVADDRYAIHRAALNRAWFLDLRGLLHDVITDLGPAS